MAESASRQEFVQLISTVWEGAPELDACLTVFEYLLANSDAKTILLSDFRAALAASGIEDTTAMIGAVSFFLGADVELIEMRYEYWSDDEITELDRKQAAAALKRNINPINGEYEENVAEKILIHYRPTLRLMQLSNSGDE